jgi:Holliday junction DNA helicase RuvB
MEDNKISILVGNEMNSEPIEVRIQPFTLVAATTRKGMLSQPLNDRFGIQFRMDFYNADDLVTIILRATKILGINLSEESLMEVAKRSRGTPRIALRLLRRLRDFIEEDETQSKCASGEFTSNILNKLGISSEGLDETDQRYLKCLKDNFNGGPVGIETLAASMAESRDTIESTIEPYLLRMGYIVRTPRGRKIADNEQSEQLPLI